MALTVNRQLEVENANRKKENRPEGLYINQQLKEEALVLHLAADEHLEGRERLQAKLARLVQQNHLELLLLVIKFFYILYI